MSPATAATTVTQPTTTQELPNLFPDLGFKGAIWLKALFFAYFRPFSWSSQDCMQSKNDSLESLVE